MQMIRTGNTLEFRTPVGNLTGYISINDLGILAATGSKVPVKTRDNTLKGFAYRDGDVLVFKCAERKFTVTWTELITCAGNVGHTCFLTRTNPDPEQISINVRETTPEPVKQTKNTGYCQIQPKKIKTNKTSFYRSGKLVGAV